VDAITSGVNTPWLDLCFNVYAHHQFNMKTLYKTKNSLSQNKAKNLTFGDLVASTYHACGEKRARKILQLAMESHLIKFSQLQCMV